MLKSQRRCLSLLRKLSKKRIRSLRILKTTAKTNATVNKRTRPLKSNQEKCLGRLRKKRSLSRSKPKTSSWRLQLSLKKSKRRYLLRLKSLQRSLLRVRRRRRMAVIAKATTVSEMRNAVEEATMENVVIASIVAEMENAEEAEVVVEEDADEAASETEREKMKMASLKSEPRTEPIEGEVVIAAEAVVTEGAVELTVKPAENSEVEDVVETEANGGNAAVKTKAPRRMLLPPRPKKLIRN